MQIGALHYECVNPSYWQTGFLSKVYLVPTQSMETSLYIPPSDPLVPTLCVGTSNAKSG